MVEGKTSRGFEFKVSENIKKDFRIVKVIRDAKNANDDVKLNAIVNLVDIVLGEQEERFFEFIAEQNEGVVPIDVVFNEVSQILELSAEADDELKN